MKKLFFTAFCAMLIALNGIDLQFIAKTGDADFDIHLNDVNIMAKADIEGFRAEMTAEYNADNKILDQGLVKLKMEPAELFLTLEMANKAKKEPAEVIKVYSANKKEGWGVIAQKLGIKPGSREFKAMKKKTQFKKDKHKREQLKKESEKADKLRDEKAKDLKPVEESEKKPFDNKAKKETGNSKSGNK